MPEGTNIGSIFLDLIVRNTVDRQVKDIAAKGQATAQRAFSGMEKAAQRSVNQATASAARMAQSAASGMQRCAQSMEASVSKSTNKSVELAKAKVRELERAYESTSRKLTNVTWSYGPGEDGDRATDRLAARLAAQREALYERLVAARERLAIQTQIAAEKESAAESAAAQKTALEEEKSANRRKAIRASMWKNMLSTAGAGAKGLITRLLGIEKGFDGGGRAARRFGSRFREIAMGALVFNGLSAGLRNVTQYLGNAIVSTGQMGEALANLKGAAASAASPIIQVLTPALTALANMAATVFFYISRLAALITGKASSAAAAAAKSAGGAAAAAKKAARSLAGFDEIQKLDGKDDSSGGGGGSADAEKLNYDFRGKSPFLDSVLAAVEAGQWSQVGALVAQKINSSLAVIQWPDIQEKARQWTQNLVDTLNGFVGGLNWGLVGNTIGNGLNTAIAVAGTFFHEFDWPALGKKLGEGFDSLVDTFDWLGFARLLGDKLIGALSAITAFLSEVDWQALGNRIGEFLRSVDWAGIAGGALELLKAGLFSAWELLCGFVEGLFADSITWAKSAGLSTAEGILFGILEVFYNIGSWIKTNMIDPLVNAVCDLLGIHSPSTVFAEIGKNLVQGLLNGISGIWDKITSFFANVFSNLVTSFSKTWNAILSTVSGIVDRLRDKVTSVFGAIQSTVSSIFNAVRNTVTSIWNGIVTAIKGAINGIIGAINGMISGIVGGINAIVSTLNGFSFKIPDWVPEWGGKNFGLNLGYVTAPQIPMLADGGVITQPTLAMMGEYSGARSNPEIVAPQSIIEETVGNVMRELVDSNMQGFEAVVAVLRDILEAVLGIEVGDDVIGRAVERYQRKMAIVKGGQ